jgi:hypothetical protein
MADENLVEEILPPDEENPEDTYIPDDSFEVNEDEPEMEIINSGDDRGVKTLSTMFLRFVSKDGIDEYPTVILLANRIFLRDEDRGGEHIGVTEKLALGDDFLWFKTEAEGGFKGIADKMTSVAEKEEESDKEGEGEEGDSSQGEGGSEGPLQPVEKGLSGPGFFKAIEDAPVTTQFFRSKQGFYILREDTLSFSKTSPFDEEGVSVPLTSPEDLLMVYTIASFDLLLTKHTLWRYYPETGEAVPLLSFQNEATAFCRTRDYFVVSTLQGLYLIFNIDMDTETLAYEHITHTSAADGLINNNKFTFCFPGEHNVIEVNGEGMLTCLYDCDSRTGRKGDKATLFGCTVCYDRNEPLLVTSGGAYDTQGNNYEVTGVKAFINHEDYLIFSHSVIETNTETSEDGSETTHEITHRYLTVYRKESDNDPIIFHFPYTIVNCYLEGNCYLLDDKGNAYKSNMGGDSGETIIYLIAFKYKEWKKQGKPNKMNIKRVVVDFIKYIELFFAKNNEELATVDGEETDFVFMITEEEVVEEPSEEGEAGEGEGEDEPPIEEPPPEPEPDPEPEPEPEPEEPPQESEEEEGEEPPQEPEPEEPVEEEEAGEESEEPPSEEPEAIPEEEGEPSEPSQEEEGESEGETEEEEPEKKMKRVWKVFGCDKRYNDTFNRMTEAFDID